MAWRHKTMGAQKEFVKACEDEAASPSQKGGSGEVSLRSSVSALESQRKTVQVHEWQMHVKRFRYPEFVIAVTAKG